MVSPAPPERTGLLALAKQGASRSEGAEAPAEPMRTRASGGAPPRVLTGIKVAAGARKAVPLLEDARVAQALSARYSRPAAAQAPTSTRLIFQQWGHATAARTFASPGCDS